MANQQEEATANDEEKAPAEEGEEADTGNDEKQDAGSAEGGETSTADTSRSKAMVEQTFENFLTRCQEDIDDRKNKRVQLFDTYKQKLLLECTFQPKITASGSANTNRNGQQIGHSLYYRGLLDMQNRLERQKKRLEEVVEAEKAACPFKPSHPRLQDVRAQYKENIRTPRMTAPQPTPRKDPLRLDLSEELNRNVRDARDLYRQDPRMQKTKAGYVEASIDRFHALTSHLQEAIDANAPAEGGEMSQGAFSSPLGLGGGGGDE